MVISGTAAAPQATCVQASRFRAALDPAVVEAVERQRHPAEQVDVRVHRSEREVLVHAHPDAERHAAERRDARRR